MRIFIDTDVLLDVLLARELHFEASARVLDWSASHPGRTGVAWHTLANLHYLSADGAENFIRELLEFTEIPRSGSEHMQQALDLGFPDLEDAMVTSAAMLFGAQVLVTRNGKDFRKSPIKVMSPDQVSTLLP